MRHAYGSAAEVPGLLRNLADPDPAIREVALDQMYGAVHHQGDVYPCTVATIPFLLRIAGCGELPGRAEVLHLLASIGSAEDPTGLTGPYRKANQAVAEAYPMFVGLLADDPDPQVRAAAIAVLPACPGQASAAVTRLLDRLPEEQDPMVRAAIMRGAAELARRGTSVGPVRERLAGLLTTEPDPQLRLVVLTELASLPDSAVASDGQPGSRPLIEVDDVLPLIDAIYRTGTPTTPPAGFETDTLLGAIRQRREQSDEGRHAPQAAALVRTVAASFGDRVTDRVRLLTALLRSPDPECRLDALYPAGNLVDRWRGDYAELIALVGDQLRAGQPPQLGPRAVHLLENLGGLAAPAVDALVAALTTAERVQHPSTDGQTPWVIEWAQGLPTVGPGLRALAGTGDPRALPMLAWVLDREQLPRDVGYLVAGYGAQAASLVPVIRRRLNDLPTDDPRDDRRDSLVAALARIGPAAAEALPEMVDLPVTPAVLRALAAIGPTAEALPILRAAAQSPDRATATAAVKALWLVAGDADAALDVADRYLDGNEYAQRDAVEILAELGPAARTRAGRLRRLTRRRDRFGWLPLSAARALWRVTRDPVPALPTLDLTWHQNPHTRRVVASVWAEIGPDAAAARPLLTEELGRVRRHNAMDGGYSSAQVTDDEELLGICRAALAALG
ncbi:hypothetical protein GCM10027280_01660 [Micromonospora polyrhachis]